MCLLLWPTGGVFCPEELERVELVVLAACSLHNMLISDHLEQVRSMVDQEDPVTCAVYYGE